MTLEVQIFSHTVPQLIALSDFDDTIAAPLKTISVAYIIAHIQ